MNELKIKGIYKHFKGDYYIVEDIAIHSETKEEYVIYRALYGNNNLYIRPKDMWSNVNIWVFRRIKWNLIIKNIQILNKSIDLNYKILKV